MDMLPAVPSSGPKDLTMLPAIPASGSKDMATFIGQNACTTEILKYLPEQLVTLVTSRLAPQDDDEDMSSLPGMKDSSLLDVTYLKLISQNTRVKTFKGEDLKDGSVLGRSVIYQPVSAKSKQLDAGFPFIVLHATTGRVYGTFLSGEGRMETYCASEDGKTPSMVNDWGAKHCASCPHHPDNLPAYDAEAERKPGIISDRCKSEYSLIGIGGDFRDIYVLKIKGKAIMSLYFKQIIPHMRALAKERLQTFAVAFNFKTVNVGNYYDYILDPTCPVTPVIATASYPGDSLFSFTKEQGNNGPQVTLQLLKALQKMCRQYAADRLSRAQENVAAYIASTATVQPAANSFADEASDGEGAHEAVLGLE